ncbi:hypothetical protein ACOKFD_07645 [Flagellimonas sp. S174]|uniref:hypothetical protein n=1 Tax=Flagellimonas sp. S174 TaxID=3410790 RepID=UPI003BF5749B
MKTSLSFNLYLLAFTTLIIISLVSCNKYRKTNNITENDKQEIERLARDLPLILSDEGWNAYQKKFSSDYMNWSMVSDQVRGRKEFLSLVKKWYDEGNRANGTTIKSIDFVPLGDDSVMFLYALEERFANLKDYFQDSSRDIRFVGIYRKENRIWKNTFTAFMDLPNSKS